jgi:assimilatory nitrate reductase catalytic subunit
VIFEELRRASAGGAADYAGVTYERIVAEDGIFWPCPSEHQRGTPRLFLDRFATASVGISSTNDLPSSKHRAPAKDHKLLL